MTLIALVHFFPGVLLEMSFDGWSRVAWIVALCALVRFLPGMNKGVLLQIAFLTKWLVTLQAIVLLESIDPTVGLLVVRKSLSACKCPGTHCARLLFCHLQNTPSRPFWVLKLTDGLTLKKIQTTDNSHFLLAPSEYRVLYLPDSKFEKKNYKENSNNWPLSLSQTLKWL